MNVQTKLIAMKIAAAKIRSQDYDSAYMNEWGRAFGAHADSVTIPLMTSATREVYERWRKRPLVVTRRQRKDERMTETTEITNSEDVIDSRDVVARIEALKETLDDGEQLEVEEADELETLLALAEEGKDVCEWEDGEALIRDSHFQEYAQDFAEDIGAIDPTAAWPNSCIDWEHAARELQYDYSSMDFDGISYWVRSS